MEVFKIYLARLAEAENHPISGEVPPAFLEVEEEALSFPSPVRFSGIATLSNGFFVLHLKVATEMALPCLICNEKVRAPLAFDDFYLSEKAADVKGAIFDFKEELRSAILTKAPAYFECNNGHCPEREALKKYLK
jgi:hypothetical protein